VEFRETERRKLIDRGGADTVGVQIVGTKAYSAGRQGRIPVKIHLYKKQIKKKKNRVVCILKESVGRHRRRRRLAGRRHRHGVYAVCIHRLRRRLSSG